MQEELKKRGAAKSVVPIIVIYPNPGHKNAELVLDRIYTLFKDIDGADITPEYNKKITSLIFYAQGNRDEKVSSNWQHYFQQPDMIFYDSNILPPEDGYNSHALKDPSKN